MTKIKSPNYTSWGNSNESVNQPSGINYDQLFNKLAEVKKSPMKDLRKPLSKQATEEEDAVSKIDKSSIIPVPGLMVEHENSESDWQPSSEWQNAKGVFWGQ